MSPPFTAIFIKRCQAVFLIKKVLIAWHLFLIFCRPSRCDREQGSALSRDRIPTLEFVTSAFRQCRAKAVVDVRVRPVIVQVQIENAGIGTVTPIAATDSTLTTPPPKCYLSFWLLIHPPIIRPISSFILAQFSYLLGGR